MILKLLTVENSENIAPGLEYKTTATGEKGDTYDAMFQFNADLFWF
jgi:hypothetical protein